MRREFSDDLVPAGSRAEIGRKSWRIASRNASSRSVEVSYAYPATNDDQFPRYPKHVVEAVIPWLFRPIPGLYHAILRSILNETHNPRARTFFGQNWEIYEKSRQNQATRAPVPTRICRSQEFDKQERRAEDLTEFSKNSCPERPGIWSQGSQVLATGMPPSGDPLRPSPNRSLQSTMSPTTRRFVHPYRHHALASRLVSVVDAGVG